MTGFPPALAPFRLLRATLLPALVPFRTSMFPLTFLCLLAPISSLASLPLAQVPCSSGLPAASALACPLSFLYRLPTYLAAHGQHNRQHWAKMFLDSNQSLPY